MKKTFLISSAFLLPGIMLGQSATQVTTGPLWSQTGGMMALGISANGRYISGACRSWEGFLFDTQTGKLIDTSQIDEVATDEGGAIQFYAVTDDGVAYGWDANGAISIDMEGNYRVVSPSTREYPMSMPKAVTPDGGVLVGFVSPSQTMSLPCYWEDGEIHILPFSTTEEAGFSINQGCRALAVSRDGSIISGILVNRANTFPLVYWRRQADGTYEYVPAFRNHYEDSRTVNGEYKEYYTTDLPKLFQPAALSPDGKTVAVYIQRVLDGKVSPNYELALYDINSDEITIVIPYDSSNLLYSDDDFEIVGLSDSGIMAGFSGMVTASRPFVLFPGDYSNALSPTEAFPGLDLLEQYEDFDLQWGGLYLFTAMSSDASTICGYIEKDIDDPEYGIPYGFETFYISTGIQDTGVKAVDATEAYGPAETQYFTIDGIRVDGPVRGLYIVRSPEGKVTKMIGRE